MAHVQNNKARRATATASNEVLAKDIPTSAHKRNKSASNISKMAGNKQQQRAFGDDVSNSRRELKAGTVGGDAGYKTKIENIKPNLTGAENGKGLIAPAVRPPSAAQITGKTKQVSLTTVSGSVAQATYPVNSAQVARPRALSKRAGTATVFRDEYNANTVVLSVETAAVQSPVGAHVFDEVDDQLSPAVAAMSISPCTSPSVSSSSESPCQQLIIAGDLVIPTADGGVEVWGLGASSRDLYGQISTVGQSLPRLENATDRKLRMAAAYVNISTTEKDVLDDLDDISMCVEYADEIFEHMKVVELKNGVKEAYMKDFQTEVKPDMRRVLLDWIVQVHQRFSMLPETLFLAVNYIDRFLSKKVVSLGKLQLVGATALLLAAKFEEVNAPTVAEMVYMVDEAYDTNEVVKAEEFMLKHLEWNMQFPGPMSFLRRISKADDYDIQVRTLAKYILEVIMMNYDLAHLPPSMAAAGSICVSRFMLNRGSWTSAHVHYSGYLAEDLVKVCEKIADALRVDPMNHFKSVFEKYSKATYNSYATVALGIVRGVHGQRLPFTLPRELGDGQIFDYEEQVDGATAHYRSHEIARLGLSQFGMISRKELIIHAQAVAAMVRRYERRGQAARLDALFAKILPPKAWLSFAPAPYVATQYTHAIIA